MKIFRSLAELQTITAPPSSPSATSTASTAATHGHRQRHRTRPRPQRTAPSPSPSTPIPPASSIPTRARPHHPARPEARAPRRHRPRRSRSSFPSPTTSPTGPPASSPRRVLRDALHAVEVHEGETFRFGHDAAGRHRRPHPARPRPRLQRPHLRSPYVSRGAPISSSRIRALIAAGDMSAGPRPPRPPLRHPQHTRLRSRLRHTLRRPHHQPRALRRPAPRQRRLHHHARASAGERRTFRGVTNIGNRPTFGADSFAVETHLFDFEPIDLTEDTPLELTFLHRLRGERRFESPEALRTQIGLDVGQANRYFALWTPDSEPSYRSPAQH